MFLEKTKYGKKIHLFILFLFVINVCFAKKFNLSGTILDKEDGEKIIGAVLIFKGQKSHNCVTDIYGNYLISLEEGNYSLNVSYLGYSDYIDTISINSKRIKNIKISQKSHDLDEVIISSMDMRSSLKKPNMGVEKINIKEIQKLPAIFGERDVIKSLQLLPGVKAESDGSSGFNVRGGNVSQNLILLDGVPVLNAGHILGIFGTFNNDAIREATLYKGSMSAEYGGRLSSILNITSKDGNMRHHTAEASVGLLSAQVHYDGPIIKDKLAASFSLRRTYFDAFLQLSDKYKENNIYFYDLNGKITYNISKNNKLFLSCYSGTDNLSIFDFADMRWKNAYQSGRWWHSFSDNFYVNTTLYNTTYDSDNSLEILSDYDLNSSICQKGLKHNYTLNKDNQTFKFGGEILYDKIKSRFKRNESNKIENRKGLEASAWINDEWTLSEKHIFSLGLRMNWNGYLGKGPYYEIDDEFNIINKTLYENNELVGADIKFNPRIAYSYRLSKNKSIKFGYNRMTQNVHSVINGATNMPFSRFILSSNLIKPETSDMVSLGYITATSSHKYEFKSEVYYKKLNDIVDYRDGISFSSEIEMEKLLDVGRGRAYGLELNLSKNKGDFTGWLSYTLSKAENKMPNINSNRWYTSSSDRTHDITLVMMYKLSKRWSMSSSFSYSTGQAITAPSAKYKLNDEIVYYYDKKNGYRAPAYQRLDLGFTYISKENKTFKSEWNFGLYNAYNKYNPYVISYVEDDEKSSGMKVEMTSLFGIIPSISYKIYIK